MNDLWTILAHYSQFLGLGVRAQVWVRAKSWRIEGLGLVELAAIDMDEERCCRVSKVRVRRVLLGSRLGLE